MNLFGVIGSLESTCWNGSLLETSFLRPTVALLGDRFFIKNAKIISMKIYVLGSNAFMHEMVAAKDKLCELGLDGWIHPDYEDLVSGKKNEMLERLAKGERAQIKKENNYLKVHFQHIKDSDGVLIVNLRKNNVDNYIGGNCLIEMGQAYVLDKKIFLLNDLPVGLPYNDEIESMDPVCLYGRLENIKNSQ